VFLKLEEISIISTEIIKHYSSYLAGAVFCPAGLIEPFRRILFEAERFICKSSAVLFTFHYFYDIIILVRYQIDNFKKGVYIWNIYFWH